MWMCMNIHQERGVVSGWRSGAGEHGGLVIACCPQEKEDDSCFVFTFPWIDQVSRRQHGDEEADQSGAEEPKPRGGAWPRQRGFELINVRGHGEGCADVTMLKTPPCPRRLRRSAPTVSPRKQLGAIANMEEPAARSCCRSRALTSRGLPGASREPAVVSTRANELTWQVPSPHNGAVAGGRCWSLGRGDNTVRVAERFVIHRALSRLVI